MRADQFAAEAMVAHSALVAQLRSMYLSLRLAGQPAAAAARARFDVSSAQHVARFVNTLSDMAHRLLQEHDLGGFVDPKLAQRALDFVAAMRALALGYVAQVKQKARGAGLVSVVDTQSVFAKLAVKRDESIAFTAVDSAQRRWQGDKLARFLARDFAYQTLIDLQVERAGDLLQVVYPNPDHADQGLVLSRSGAEGRLALTEYRDTIFHPNASAQVVPYVPAHS